ncbi:peptidoglycan-binding protein LysM [Glaesserella sp.]|uniref:peptidoglycan-binding protein LysM n=1 Tax=Glaesserella sp. TaxID=2094731 RepID=UPI0035A0DC9C
MGLFDFAADIGKKLFNKEEDASKAVTDHIAEDNPGIENLNVTVENGTAKITGAASTAVAIEKAILMAGNVAGINNVNIDDVVIKDGQIAGDDEFYVIQKGDTLWKIAEKAYGNGAKYKAIVDANKEVIKHEDKIFPGQKIRIPKSL